MVKVCIECKLIKDDDIFIKGRNICKDCYREYKKNYRLKNIEYIKVKNKKYYLDNKELICNNQKESYNSNKEKKLEYQKKYASINKEKISKYKMEYQREKRKNDPLFKLKYVVSRLIRNSLKCKGLSKNKKSIDILGCDINFFKEYLEVRFTDDMNWSNYGVVWDIDHIIPLATTTNEYDIIRLNHYTNLQPLDSYVNRFIKRDKLDFEVPE